MSKLDALPLEAAFEASQSGKGVRLSEVGELREFVAYARTQAAIVCNVEIYELRNEQEIARVDLSIYQGGAEEQALPPGQRIALADDALGEALAVIEKEGIDCVFQVWADRL